MTREKGLLGTCRTMRICTLDVLFFRKTTSIYLHNQSQQFRFAATFIKPNASRIKSVNFSSFDETTFLRAWAGLRAPFNGGTHLKVFNLDMVNCELDEASFKKLFDGIVADTKGQVSIDWYRRDARWWRNRTIRFLPVTSYCIQEAGAIMQPR